MNAACAKTRTTSVLNNGVGPLDGVVTNDFLSAIYDDVCYSKAPPGGGDGIRKNVRIFFR